MQSRRIHNLPQLIEPINDPFDPCPRGKAYDLRRLSRRDRRFRESCLDRRNQLDQDRRDRIHLRHRLRIQGLSSKKSGQIHQRVHARKIQLGRRSHSFGCFRDRFL